MKIVSGLVFYSYNKGDSIKVPNIYLNSKN